MRALLALLWLCPGAMSRCPAHGERMAALTAALVTLCHPTPLSCSGEGARLHLPPPQGFELCHYVPFYGSVGAARPVHPVTNWMLWEHSCPLPALRSVGQKGREPRAWSRGSPCK